MTSFAAKGVSSAVHNVVSLLLLCATASANLSSEMLQLLDLLSQRGGLLGRKSSSSNTSIL